jgi:hypothetical protein
MSSSDADTSKLSTSELAELSALADGTLDPARRDAVANRISGSPEASALYERERSVVGLLHQLRASERAPERLRARLEAQRRRPPRRARLAYSGGLAGALAAVILALVLILPGGAPGAPSLSQAAALADRGASAPAPPIKSGGLKLNQDIENVYFPDWSARFGWTAAGQRSDRINGRLALTVYYSWHGKRIAYTIVGAPALHSPATGVTWLHGIALRTLSLHGRLVVTWQRRGHTCVLSGAGVSAGVLRTLAAWGAPDRTRD